MAGIIYTNQSSKLSKKQRVAREQLIKEQRAIKKELKVSTKTSSTVIRTSSSNSVSADRSTRHIPSRNTGMGYAAAKPAPVYTGTSMIGIGQMHKSNAVPVFSQEDAVAIASMRR